MQIPGYLYLKPLDKQLDILLHQSDKDGRADGSNLPPFIPITFTLPLFPLLSLFLIPFIPHFYTYFYISLFSSPPFYTFTPVLQ